ncbi:FUSC family protein [Belnapia sp. T6]|uniref:FUSC family protein n=1 Tax=Belnapia mucosa TaxID=2804532 RepID=A0ABS1V3A5_9PROT|nr:FUSC family protein [Belnapia mucosa]MBL6456161.1 FUSC family protein [Belnapia mucosa]
MARWLPGRREWAFSAVTFAAATLALLIAFWTGLERPYWAAATVYITAQPSAGALRAKGIGRLCGTFAGAAFAVLAVPNLVAAPPLLVLVMALWVGLCLTCALLDPTPRSYGFMLAGYTAAIIGFPAVDAPEEIFTTAILRVEEIGLGIACTWVLHGILLPRPAAPDLLRRLEAWTADIARLAADALGGGMEGLAEDRRRLARDGSALDALFQQARYEAGSRAALRRLPVLRGQARRMPVLASAAADRILALRAADPAAATALAPLLDAIAARIGGSPGDDPGLEARLAAAEAEASAAGGWSGLMREGLLARLRELLSTAEACRGQAGRIAGAARGDLGAGPMPGHVDPLLVGLSGLSAVVSVCLCCAFWILAGWPGGATAAMMSAVGASLFAALDDPTPAILRFMEGTVLAAAAAALYLFAILPALDGFIPLIIALGLLYLPLGALLAVPALTPRMAPIALNALALMAIQASYGADPAGFLESAIGMLVGFAMALVVTRVLRGAGVAWRVARLVEADRRDLARLAEGRRPADLRRIAAAMLDRFEALSARLGAADAATLGRRELAELRAAFNLLRLREVAAGLPAALRPAIEAAVAATGALARGRLAPEAALARIDAALAAALPEPAARPAALALSGLRMALFPGIQAPPPALAA